MFPYPSGEGLHVGHPLGYIATDVYARYYRMNGRNVLHALGFDAFGLPAEQYAVQTGTHPRTRTEANVVNFRRQLGRLGLGHDSRRSFSTTDVEFYKWTQWIFLQIYNAWFDTAADKARPIAELITEFDSGARSLEDGRQWAELSAGERSDVIDGHRLVYRADSMVNWCPGLGTVLANEEVTADGRSDRGNFPVFRKRLRQWMMRITAYSDRLLDDLDVLDWPDKVKSMQRNWIGRSTGATALFSATRPTAPARFADRHRGIHHPARHPVRRHLSGAGPRARPGRRAGRRRVAGRGRPFLDVRRRDTSRRPWPPTAARSRPSQTSSVRRAGRRPASSWAATPPTRPTVNRCRSSSPTTCWRDTAPGRSWPCRATTNGTGISPGNSVCRSSKSLPAAIFRSPHTPATVCW